MREKYKQDIQIELVSLFRAERGEMEIERIAVFSLGNL
jgi:hypothetical protein